MIAIHSIPSQILTQSHRIVWLLISRGAGVQSEISNCKLLCPTPSLASNSIRNFYRSKTMLLLSYRLPLSHLSLSWYFISEEIPRIDNLKILALNISMGERAKTMSNLIICALFGECILLLAALYQQFAFVRFFFLICPDCGWNHL